MVLGRTARCSVACIC